jgi:hypothetical protein
MSCLDLSPVLAHDHWVTESPRQRLARIMDERRRFLRLTWDQVADRGSISYETIRQVRSGSQEIRGLTKRGIEIGLGWTPGSLDRALEGGTPTPTAQTETQPATRAPSHPSLAEVAIRQIEEILDMDGLTSRMREDTIRGIVYRYRRQAAQEAARRAARPEDEPGRQSDTG